MRCTYVEDEEHDNRLDVVDEDLGVKEGSRELEEGLAGFAEVGERGRSAVREDFSKEFGRDIEVE